MPRPAPAPRPSAGAALLVLLLKGLWVAFVIATPLLGAWAASSLAAYSNGPVALAAGSGLLLFPLLPLAWEGFATWRRRRRGIVKPRILTFGDRLILRTLALNLVFLGALVGTRPALAFAALSTRGDWMLDGRAGPTADAARRFLFRAADRLEWAYLATHEDRFAKQGSDPTPSPSSSSTAAPAPSASASSTTPAPKHGGATSTEASAWPLPPSLHPAVASMPADAERSIETVARYLADRDSTESGRLKAAHDWVADRIAYDAPAYVARRFPPQDARSVFAARTGVCAGYAELLAELGKQLGLTVLYLHGDARTDGMKETGESHAWNAAKVDGRWVLIDPTWDSGTVSGTTFKKRYVTDYFATPPEIFSVDHFPSDARWQLRATPLSRGEFFRQPMMTPRFYAERRELVSPTRSQITVRGAAEITLRGPASLFTLATFSADGAEARRDCKVDRGELVRITCDLPAKGRYAIDLFSSPEQYGSYHYIGRLEANRED